MNTPIAFAVFVSALSLNAWAATRNADTPAPEAIRGLETSFSCDGEKPVVGPAAINYYTSTHGGRLQNPGDADIRLEGLTLTATDARGVSLVIGTSDAPKTCTEIDSDTPYVPSWNEVRLSPGIELFETVHVNTATCAPYTGDSTHGWMRRDDIVVAIVNTVTRQQANVHRTSSPYFQTEEACRAQ